MDTYYECVLFWSIDPLAGTAGFGPAECKIQSLVPYQLGYIPLCSESSAVLHPPCHVDEYSPPWLFVRLLITRNISSGIEPNIPVPDLY